MILLACNYLLKENIAFQLYSIKVQTLILNHIYKEMHYLSDFPSSKDDHVIDNFWIYEPWNQEY